MQASCPKCAQKIVIDDARVPDRAFSVKCPKCQTAVKFAGKAAAAVSAAPPSAAPLPPAAMDPGSAADPEAMRAEMMAQVRREMTLGGEAVRAGGGRALVALADRGQTGSITLPLSRQGYHVDTMDNHDEASRLIEQGVYDVVVATRAPTPGGAKESLYQRLSRLSPDARRRVFLVLVGDDFKTGDGVQAWAVTADLVMNTRDLANADAVLTKTVDERNRMYQTFLDARRRNEATAG